MPPVGFRQEAMQSVAKNKVKLKKGAILREVGVSQKGFPVPFDSDKVGSCLGLWLQTKSSSTQSSLK